MRWSFVCCAVGAICGCSDPPTEVIEGSSARDAGIDSGPTRRPGLDMSGVDAGTLDAGHGDLGSADLDLGIETETTLTSTTSIVFTITGVPVGSPELGSLVGLEVPFTFFPNLRDIGPALIGVFSNQDDPGVLIPVAPEGFVPYSCAEGIVERLGTEVPGLGSVELRGLGLLDSQLSDGLSLPLTEDITAFVRVSAETSVTEVRGRLRVDHEPPELRWTTERGRDLRDRTDGSTPLILPFEGMVRRANEMIPFVPPPGRIRFEQPGQSTRSVWASPFRTGVLSSQCPSSQRLSIPAVHLFFVRDREWWPAGATIRVRDDSMYSDHGGNQTPSDPEGIEIRIASVPDAVGAVDFSKQEPEVETYGTRIDSSNFGCSECLGLDLDSERFSGLVALLQDPSGIDQVELTIRILSSDCEPGGTPIDLAYHYSNGERNGGIYSEPTQTVRPADGLPGGMMCQSSSSTFTFFGADVPLSDGTLPVTMGVALEARASGDTGSTILLVERIEATRESN